MATDFGALDMALGVGGGGFSDYLSPVGAYFTGQPTTTYNVKLNTSDKPGQPFGPPSTSYGGTDYLAAAGKIAQTPAALTPEERNILSGYASTGGVSMGGSTDPYALLPHEQEQLNQQIDAINSQAQAAVGQQLQQLVKNGMDPNTARLVAKALMQKYNANIQQTRTNFMEQVRQNRQQTYANLVPQLSQFMGVQQAGHQQQYGELMGVADMAANLSATEQANQRTLGGFLVGQATGAQGSGARQIQGAARPGPSFGAGAGLIPGVQGFGGGGNAGFGGGGYTPYTPPSDAGPSISQNAGYGSGISMYDVLGATPQPSSPDLSATFGPTTAASDISYSSPFGADYLNYLNPMIGGGSPTF